VAPKLSRTAERTQIITPRNFFIRCNLFTVDSISDDSFRRQTLPTFHNMEWDARTIRLFPKKFLTSAKYHNL
jgi:hypothetical protein